MDALIGLVILVFLVALYFLPAIVAGWRSHHNTGNRMIASIGLIVALALVAILSACAEPSDTTASTPVPTVVREASPVAFEVATCGTELFGTTRSGVASGTVTSRATETIDVFIEVNWEDRNGVIVDYGNAWVRNLPPGRSARWEATTYDRSARSCTAQISGVYG